jgi:hypothetical protein
MNAVDRFKQLAAEERFKGWPLVGKPKLGKKIPFFGQTLDYQLRTGNGVEDYTSIIRHFGWCVVFGLTVDENVVTLCQWKPGVNRASWELPPGGIGKIDSSISSSNLLDITRTYYQRETGYNTDRHNWHYLGSGDVESGKYRGAGPEDHGLKAHMFLATNLEQIHRTRSPNPNEIMETVMVPLGEFDEVIDSGLFCELSALPCALLALRRLRRRR